MADHMLVHRRKKGGLLTMPFIIANEAFEKVASYGLLPNMILYLMMDYQMSVARGTNILFFWTAATNFTPIVGAFVADSYLGRFRTIGLASICSFLGMVLLWLTAMFPHVKPPACNQFITKCQGPTSSQLALLISSFTLMSIGSGGVRPCSLAFGADQLDRKDNPKNERVLESFFGWYYATSSVAVIIALTGIVYIQDHYGWKIGFGVPAILMAASVLLFVFAFPLYIRRKATTSLFSGFVQVIVASYRNRKLALPPRNSAGWYYHNKDSDIVMPTEKLRYLNKACILRSPETDINENGFPSNPWRLCTVEKVEELKALLKVMPLWSSGIMMSINISQTTFQLLQAKSMDRHLTSNFQIPAGSFGMFFIVGLVFWVVVYDRVILPLAAKIKGKQVRLGMKLRMGIGLALSTLAMFVSAIVEKSRRKQAIEQGFLNNAQGVVTMSAMWLIPQYVLNGFAEAFNAIGQTEFYYAEFPKSMSSIAASLFGLGMAVANLLASLILSLVDKYTSGRGKVSWVSSNINQARYDNYYWLLAVMSCVNMLFFLVCSWAYGPCLVKGTKVGDEGREEDKEDLSNRFIREMDDLEELEETHMIKTGDLKA